MERSEDAVAEFERHAAKYEVMAEKYAHLPEMATRMRAAAKSSTECANVMKAEIEKQKAKLIEA